ncbi:MAG: cytochrome C oxidase subunit IV family protein [Chloroflexota bacterium]
MVVDTDQQHHTQEEEHHHPSSREYANIAAILSAITAVEVALYFITGVSHATLVVMLMALMVVKFVYVVAYYMHLKYDHPYFTLIFAGGLFVSISIVLALGALFGIYSGGGEDIIRELPGE